MKENWSKDSFVGEFFARFGWMDRAILLIASVGGYMVLTYLGGALYLVLVWSAAIALLIVGYVINEVVHDMPAKGVRPFHSRRHTIIWRICQRGLIVVGASASFLVNPGEYTFSHYLLYVLSGLIILTWIDLFSYRWNDKKPEDQAPKAQPSPEMHKLP